jgi:hypothetical protein
VCNVHTFPASGGLTHVFELNSHMHQRGKRWRTFLGSFTCNNSKGQSVACDPLDPSQCGDGQTCTDPTGRDPMQSLIYTNFLYNDPVHLVFNPPMVLGSKKADRSMTYCALYDNGFTDPTKVKKQSTSPPNPYGQSTCAVATHCTAGMPKQPCSGTGKAARDASCDSSPGAGDGVCDACTLNGGVTTEDEMFLLLGSYFQVP